MRTYRLAILAALIVTPAFAAEQSATPPATEMISASDAFQIANALAVVGGNHDVVIGQGASQRAVPTPYDLSSETRWAIADDMTGLRPLLQTVQEVVRTTRAAAEAKHGGSLDACPVDKMDCVASKKVLDEDLRKISDTKRPVAKLFHIKRGDLKLNVNAIPIDVLSALAPIIDP
jgi:hypothetical protein